jgi:sigma-B regulation protein RsbU (phosphoserine phosphatase)
VADESLDFAPGETLLLFSDGVSEAFGPGQELFGDDRLLEQLTREPGETAAETVASVRTAVRRHAADTPQSDDITIVAVRRVP